MVTLRMQHWGFPREAYQPELEKQGRQDREKRNRPFSEEYIHRAVVWMEASRPAEKGPGVGSVLSDAVRLEC